MGVSRDDFPCIPRDAYSYEELPVRSTFTATGLRGAATEDGRYLGTGMRWRRRPQAAAISRSNRKSLQQTAVLAP